MINGSPDPVQKALEEAQTLGHGAMLVTFDPESQALSVKFDPTVFKTWDFVVALLDMAKKQAQTMGEMARMAAMQNQAMQQHQANQLANQIKLGRH